MSETQDYDVVRILQALPHRYPLLLVDRVSELVKGERITAIKGVTMNEQFFQGHFPGRPIMPGVLLCEACFQAGAIYLAKQIEKEGRSLADVTPVLSRISDARFKQMVKPGDDVTIEVTMKEKVSKFFFMQGKVLKNGKPALTIGFALAMLEPEAGK